MNKPEYNQCRRGCQALGFVAERKVVHDDSDFERSGVADDDRGRKSG